MKKIKQELESYGDSLMVVGLDNLTKIHIHTNHPGLVLESCLKYGPLTDLKISNMREQNEAMRSTAPKNSSGGFGVVSVGFGDGIIQIMKNLGADVLRYGITVVPLKVIFNGKETFLDGVDIKTEQFYQWLEEGQSATTSQPSPADFVNYYKQLLPQNCIISIHITQ